MAERSIIRELVTVLGWDVDEQTLNKFETRVASLRKNLRRMTIAAGITGGAIAAIAVKTARAGDSVAKTSKRLGISIKSLQEWRYAAQISGLEIAQIDTAITMFGRNAGEAVQGIGEAKEAFQTLGVQMKDNQGNIRELDGLLAESLGRLADEESQIKKLALAQKLFGRGGAPVVQMLAEGSEGLAKLRDRFDELGAAIDEQTAKMSEEAVDAWLDFKTAINGVIFAMGKELLPIVTELIKSATEWIAKNQMLIKYAAWSAIAIGGLATAVFAAASAWSAYKIAVLLASKASVILFAKIAAIVALLAIFALLAEDIALFFQDAGAVTVTGKAIEGLKDAVMTAIDFWKREIINFVTKTVPDAIIGAIDTAMEYLRGLWSSFADLIRTSVTSAIDAIIRALPSGLQEYLGLTEQMTPVALRPGLDFFAGEAVRQGGGAASVVANVTINQAPGETGATVATAVAARLAGKGITVPLTGLAP